MSYNAVIPMNRQAVEEYTQRQNTETSIIVCVHDYERSAHLLIPTLENRVKAILHVPSDGICLSTKCADRIADFITHNDADRLIVYSIRGITSASDICDAILHETSKHPEAVVDKTHTKDYGAMLNAMWRMKQHE